MALHSAPWPAAGRPEDGDSGAARNAVHLAMGPASTTGADDDDGNEFDDLVRMASQLLDTPIALIAVAEGEYFRMAAEHGYGKLLVPREHVICRAVGHDLPLLMLPDAAADTRFRDDPAVAIDGVRFYLGIALVGSSGLQLGVLAVADFHPRAAVPEEALVMLHRLARLAARLVERRAFERSNRIAEQIARADFSAVVVANAAGAVTFANAAAQALFGPTVADGQPVDALFPAALQLDPDAVAGWLRTGASAVHDAGTASRKLRVRAADGELRTLEAVRCAWLTDEDGTTPVADNSSVFALILRDITDRRLQQRRRRADQQDPLTGLPNHATLLSTLDALRPRNASFAVALLGLNNFRAVNDTLGHAIGDAVLQVVACRLLARLPADAHLARLDSDEFVLVFADTTVDAIEALLGTMLRELTRPCEVDHQRVHLEASIGLAMSDASDDAGDGNANRVDAKELVARAGLAMRHAKRTNGQQFRRFRPDMRAAAIDRRLLDLELRRASREGEFELHYQPQIDLATGLPTGAEALLRWRHPERGLLLPGAFIDALAHSAVALAVGRWVLQRACCDAAGWPEVAGRRLAVGVNLFPVQFDDEHLLDEVDHALALSGLAPAQLELELTETIALKNDGVAEHVLMQLRARGIRVAYDDFGTGFASLSMLQRLPVDRLKIDRSFVRNVLENRGDEAIVRSIALIARNFDLQVVAEGVETPLQAEFLRELGCQDVQGWLYSKALAPTAFDRWLVTHIDASSAKAVMHG